MYTEKVTYYNVKLVTLYIYMGEKPDNQRRKVMARMYPPLALEGDTSYLFL